MMLLPRSWACARLEALNPSDRSLSVRDVGFLTMLSFQRFFVLFVSNHPFVKFLLDPGSQSRPPFSLPYTSS